MSVSMGLAQPSRRWLARWRRAARRQVAPASLAAQPAQMGEVAAVGGQAGFQVGFEGQQQLASLWVQGEDGRAVVAGWSGEAGGQGLELQGVAVGHRLGDVRGPGLAVAD